MNCGYDLFLHRVTGGAVATQGTPSYVHLISSSTSHWLKQAKAVKQLHRMKLMRLKFNCLIAPVQIDKNESNPIYCILSLKK